MNEVVISTANVSIKEYQGNRVVTFKDIDTVHGRADGTARRNFNHNKEHFIEGEDYFKISPNEFRTAFGNMDKRQQNDVTVLTESGYLMLAKSFTDKKAWDVQRALVKSYFRCKEEKKISEFPNVETEDLLSRSLSVINNNVQREAKRASSLAYLLTLPASKATLEGYRRALAASIDILKEINYDVKTIRIM